MDIRSILSDSQSQRGPPPRLATHTPQSSYDARTEPTPSADVSAARSTPYGPPPQAGDPRAQGGYFAMQSPHPTTNHSTSASTPSVGPPSAYAQSPGSYGGGYTPRDGHPPSNVAPTPLHAAFVSPSSSTHHPNTPVSVHHASFTPSDTYAHQVNNSYPPHYHPQPQPQPQQQQQQQHPHAHPHHPPSHNHHPHPQFQSPPPPPANSIPPAQARQISPTSQFQSQPATPLGPPVHYHRASPQQQRPTSQGQVAYPEHHLRRTSQSSASSVPSRDYSHGTALAAPEPARRESVSGQRAYSYDYNERARSESVSPKTIPRPAPQREHSASSQTLSHGTPVPQPRSQPLQTPGSQPPMRRSGSLHLQEQPDPPANPYPNHVQAPPQIVPPADSSFSSSTPDRHPSVDYPGHQNPAPVLIRPADPQAAPVPMAVPRDATPLKAETPPHSLKRRASHLSETKVPLPQKRARHEKPIWARSARTTKDGRMRPLQFVDPPPRHHRPKPGPSQRQEPPAPPADRRGNGQTHQPNGAAPTDRGGPARDQADRFRTIAEIDPYESLTRKITEWVIGMLGNAPPPPGSQFEIEAKIGQVVDQETGERLVLPIASEVLLNSNQLRGRIKFQSTMTAQQHEALNNFLNDLVKRNLAEAKAHPEKERIGYDHPRENDEFFVMNEQGKQQLHEGLRAWLPYSTKPHEVRVRRTVDKSTGAIKAQIIKTRIADQNILNPDCQFDYRISISLETPWDGPHEFLTPVASLRGRNKDRMSYRHLMYQVDLTQVTHTDDPTRVEHELEVEVSTEAIRKDLEALYANKQSDLEPRIRGLIDNVRLLCRKGTVQPQR